ncbi:hypothetical protein U879_15890 [Defluviimonas sp. 20V17]|uniref:Uncharacterized protein n=1 Tax=Allgaiera indica TaxID=765699 RepID=A0AAN4URJ0_9RHOB|nr:hypothetical protein [Allgaiera indica]KDB02674.1 hypothetical protein U879_15890 [Defluviimonas sp. 20V17]GHE01812.1 hypothetical protein GCM10008024_19080 [Allgaiera indica]SDW92639.1 hypothetical protein SAMN05444006_10838 [Allgaiera indica]
MTVISDILLASGAFAAALYCYVLSRRLTRFTKLESGMGGAIAVLSAQVDDLTRALSRAQGTAAASSENLTSLTNRAEEVAGRIELLLASLHDLPQAPAAGQASGPVSGPASDAPHDPGAERKLRFTRHRSRRTDPLVLTEAAE